MNDSLKNIFGTHSYFFYYGEEHLYTNLFIYILEGIKNREKIFISMETHLFEQLSRMLKYSGVDDRWFEFKSIKSLITPHKREGLKALKDTLEGIVSGVVEEGFSGIRWVGQSVLGIQETSRDDFLSWEEDLSEAIASTKSSLMCVYDFRDYLDQKRFIDDRVLREALETHSHKLYQLEYLPVSQNSRTNR